MTTAVQQFWAGIVRTNPGFGGADDTKVTITIGTLRTIVNKAHRSGFRSGIESAKTLEGIGRPPDTFEKFLDKLKDT